MIKETNKNRDAESVLDEEFGKFIDLPDQDNTIAELAYFKAQNRGFEAGHELDDWLEAERDLLF
jgi:hypothetical protein